MRVVRSRDKYTNKIVLKLYHGAFLSEILVLSETEAEQVYLALRKELGFVTGAKPSNQRKPDYH